MVDAGPTNVVELDSRRQQQPVNAVRLLQRQQNLLETLYVRLCELHADAQWYEGQLRWERRRRREIEASLRLERELAFSFSDAEILSALGRVYGGSPLSAGEVAQALGRGRVTHSTRVRTGLALSRLSAAGMVAKFNGPTCWDPKRWASVGGADA